MGFWLDSYGAQNYGKIPDFWLFELEIPHFSRISSGFVTKYKLTIRDNFSKMGCQSLVSCCPCLTFFPVITSFFY